MGLCEGFWVCCHNVEGMMCRYVVSLLTTVPVCIWWDTTCSRQLTPWKKNALLKGGLWEQKIINVGWGRQRDSSVREEVSTAACMHSAWFISCSLAAHLALCLCDCRCLLSLLLLCAVLLCCHAAAGCGLRAGCVACGVSLHMWWKSILKALNSCRVCCVTFLVYISLQSRRRQDVRFWRARSVVRFSPSSTEKNEKKGEYLMFKKL